MAELACTECAIGHLRATTAIHPLKGLIFMSSCLIVTIFPLCGAPHMPYDRHPLLQSSDMGLLLACDSCFSAIYHLQGQQSPLLQASSSEALQSLLLDV